MLNWVSNHGPSLGIALIVGAAVALFNLARPAPPAVEVRALEPQPTPTVLLYVHVDGAVTAPGVYSLSAGSRIFEAIEAAGSTTDEADIRELNLAARVADGQKLTIPARPSAVPTRDGASDAVVVPTSVPAAPAAVAQTGPRININTATQRILETLPGIGPVTAQRIIQYRETNGPFARIEQLRDTRIVNGPTYERIKDLISTQ